eukprot:2053247-Rhodomonas_salina.3
MPGIEIAYGATGRREQASIGEVNSAMCLRAYYAMSGTDLAYAVLSAYGVTTRCPVLTSPYGATSLLSRWLPTAFAVEGEEEKGEGGRWTEEELEEACREAVRLFAGTVLRACYAMPGTDLAYGGSSLRARYAISGTGIAYGASSLQAGCVVCGTGLAFGGTVLRACYAMSGTVGTEMAYAGTRGSECRGQRPAHLLPCKSATGLRVSAYGRSLPVYAYLPTDTSSALG